MFTVSEEDLKNYLDDVLPSKLKYSDPDDSDDDGTYDYLCELPVLGEIYRSENTKNMVLYFKNGNSIREYGYIMIEMPDDEDKGSTTSFVEGDFRAEHEYNPTHEYDLLTLYNIIKKTDSKAKDKILHEFNMQTNKTNPITYIYGYLWMNAKIMNLIDEVIEADMDPKCVSVDDVDDVEEIRSLIGECEKLSNLVLDFINKLD